jgi:hypothetical protein
MNWLTGIPLLDTKSVPADEYDTSIVVEKIVAEAVPLVILVQMGSYPATHDVQSMPLGESIVGNGQLWQPP